MNDIALFYHDKYVYWHGVIMLLAVAAFILCAAGLRILQRGKMKNFLLLTTLSIPVVLLFSRFTYCFFALDSFSEIPKHLFSSEGGNSLLGAALGVLVMLLAAKPLGLLDNIVEMLDCLSPAAALGICIGRLASAFSNDDRGMEIADDMSGLLLFTCTDKISGDRVLAVFVYESVCAAVLFAAVLKMFFELYAADGSRKNFRRGDITLMFLAGFGASQGVLESMRSDSLKVIGLGFVRVLQIVALICILIPLVVFSVRTVKTHGVSVMQIVCWALSAYKLALGVYIEFIVTADTQIVSSLIMAGCLFGTLLLTIWQYRMSRGKIVFKRLNIGFLQGSR